MRREMEKEEMEVEVAGAGWEERVLEVTELAQAEGANEIAWAVEVSKCLPLPDSPPTVELGHLLVSHLLSRNNISSPLLWKYLHHAISVHLLSPLHVLSLLSSRVVPFRQSQPEAYRLYMDLLTRYIFSGSLQDSASNEAKIVKAVDDALNLSHKFGILLNELGQTIVLFTFSVLFNLLSAAAEDWGLQISGSENQRKSNRNIGQEMEVDLDEKKHNHRENLRKSNTLIAFDVIGKLVQHQRTSLLLRLLQQNIPEKWRELTKCIQVIRSSLPSSSETKIVAEMLTRLSQFVEEEASQEFKCSKYQVIRAFTDVGSSIPLSEYNYGVGRAALWLPFDLFMEDAMEGKQFPTTSAIDMLSELMKSLQAANGVSWHETFLGLWTAALRLVQRERDPLEGPVPHLDARLCILLSITPLAISKVIEEETCIQSTKNYPARSADNINDHERVNKGSFRKRSLLSSLKILGQFESLLMPPQSVQSAANVAATKAACIVSSFNNGHTSLDTLVSIENATRIGGSMWHLIVEACIARSLIDKSAYFWPGYVSELLSSLPNSASGQSSPWSTFMEGAAPLSSLKDALFTMPASSLSELEKVYEIAISGPEEDRSAAATILCGASLTRGWNLQEHAVRMVIKLLAPPAPPDCHGQGNYLISYAPLLYAVLVGITSIDTVHILSLYGMLPEVAVALLPLCEAFGSLSPTTSQTSNKGDDISVYMVFSCAFLLLLRLWKFYRPPHEHCNLGRGGAPVGSELTLEYLLLLRNNHLVSSLDTSLEKSSKDDEKSSFLGSGGQHTSNLSSGHKIGDSSTIAKPVYIDSFPKLRAWYCQHKACIASTLSGLVHGNPVRQTADRLLSLMFRKIFKGGTLPSSSGASTNSTLSSSSASFGDDSSSRPLLPAWDILAATPFVVDAVLTACAHGRLAPRDLTTALKDLVDFLPASLATIVSYFTAEVTRGVWKPASMNGSDWPSPAENLHKIEAKIKEILAATGVHVPSLTVGGNAPATLPLPLAALVSLTITFNLDKSSEFLHGVAGPALESTAAGSPWPSTPIVAALWAQKVRRWQHYIVFFSSRTVFKHDKNAVVQLLRSCFATALGSNTSMSNLTINGGVGALLGHGFCQRFAPGGNAAVAPGILYLRTFRALYDIMFITHEILALVAGAARELTTSGSTDQPGQSTKHACRLKSSQILLSTAMAKVKQASAIGASLLCITGGTGLVEMLYQETLPTWFLSRRENPLKSKLRCSILEGYAVAYLSILSGAFAWGVSKSALSNKRAMILSYHMEFVASALHGKIAVGCDHGTWKAYILGFLSMMIACAPNWIPEIKPDILKRVAKGLTGWHETELAIALLARGGSSSMGAVAELLMAG